MFVLSPLELPFHFLLGLSPRPAAAAAPLLHWSPVELAPVLERDEKRKRRLKGIIEEIHLAFHLKSKSEKVEKIKDEHKGV